MPVNFMKNGYIPVSYTHLIGNLSIHVMISFWPNNTMPRILFRNHTHVGCMGLILSLIHIFLLTLEILSILLSSFRVSTFYTIFI